MDKFTWCSIQNDGFELIGPNPNLAEAYLRKSEDALNTAHAEISRDWQISAAYYAIYFSVYAILMKIGIKCEIHACTIEFTKQFLNNHFSQDELRIITSALKTRIDAQYYTDRNIPDKRYQDLLEYAPRFLVKSKTIILQMEEKEILDIRTRFKEAVKSTRR